MKIPINIYFENHQDDTLSEWIEMIGRAVLKGEGTEECGSLSVILVGDAKISEINKQFLGNNQPTDVIAFVLEEKHEHEWGEVYISLDQAREQAAQFDTSWKEELARYVIHGILHLLGYKDTDAESKSNMRLRETHYLNTIIMESDYSKKEDV